MSDDHADSDQENYDHADPAHAGGLHHVELCVADLDAAVDFWGWLLTELGYEAKTSGRTDVPGFADRRPSPSRRPVSPTARSSASRRASTTSPSTPRLVTRSTN